MVMEKPIKPTREPDYVLRSEAGERDWWLAFWWEEKIQTNNMGFVHEFDIEHLTFKTSLNTWYRYQKTMRPKIRKAYLEWLVEKGLGLRS